MKAGRLSFELGEFWKILFKSKKKANFRVSNVEKFQGFAVYIEKENADNKKKGGQREN